MPTGWTEWRWRARRSAPGFLVLPAVVASLAAHGIAMALLAGLHDDAKPRSDNTIAVSILVDPSPAASPVPPAPPSAAMPVLTPQGGPEPTPPSPPPATAVQPAPAPAEPPPPPVERTALPELAPRPIPPPIASARVPPAPRPARSPVRATVTPSPRAPFHAEASSPAAPAPSAVTAAPPSAPAPAAAPSISAGWRTALTEWLRAHQNYPGAARANGEEGVAVVRFTVGRDGRVRDVELLRSSGSSALDAAAQDMLRGARLPPFPGDMPQQELPVTLPVRYRLER